MSISIINSKNLQRRRERVWTRLAKKGHIKFIFHFQSTMFADCQDIVHFFLNQAFQVLFAQLLPLNSKKPKNGQVRWEYLPNPKLWTAMQSWLETRATRKASLAFDYKPGRHRFTSTRHISQNSCNFSLLSIISNLEILFFLFFHPLKITLRSVLAPKFSFHYNPGAKKIDVIRSSFHVY